MAPSQLKRLKASLREQGVVGPQKSKKQKIQASKNLASKDKRVARSVALEGIRQQFNPFEVKKLARGAKWDSSGVGGGVAVLGRPGVTKGLGEEIRRKTLLTEMHRRKKVGGIYDRRFGEDDPTMTPEEKALQRFVKEKSRGSKKGGLFDLDDDEEEAVEELTHLGQSLSFAAHETPRDDFDEAVQPSSDNDLTDLEGNHRGKKRRKLSMEENGYEENFDPVSEPDDGRPKTKAEVMKEVMAKSKFHKYERQKTKEDDDDLRAKLDEGLADIYELMQGTKPLKTANPPDPGPAQPHMNADRALLLEGKNRAEADREYDERLRQMAFDLRSKPTSRTLTEEEKAEKEAERLRELEEKRLKRMKGEEEDELEDQPDMNGTDMDFADFEDETNEAGIFGKGIPVQSARKELDVEDEDDFLLEDDLVASDSDAVSQIDNEDGSENSRSDSEEASKEETDDEEEKEFVAGLLTKDDEGRPQFQFQDLAPSKINGTAEINGLAFTYPCPQTHKELLHILQDVSTSDIPTVVQRIRALYHPKLSSENKEKLGVFSQVLVEHLSYLTNRSPRPPFQTLETLIRHVHSLAKSFPKEVGEAFRTQLKIIHKERPTNLRAGDLVIFTAIGTIFPTSDHFHQVVTPATLSIARYLGQRMPQTIANLAKGIYLCTLLVQYQQLSKRYIPELVNYTLNILAILAPVEPREPYGEYPSLDSPEALRISRAVLWGSDARRMRFWDIEHKECAEDDVVKTALLKTTIQLVDRMSTLWRGKSAYPEIFQPFVEAFEHLKSKRTCSGKISPATKALLVDTHASLTAALSTALAQRQPLALHNHRPLAIKTAIPKFEESYHPDKHYDPDRERTELAKLQAEYKRERKGALRELRKDASFVARESLREKKERDLEYERKYRRLVAEVQAEEGREKNVYERERRARKEGGRRGR